MNPNQPLPTGSPAPQTPNVTPQEQQQYDTVVTAGLNMIFGKDAFQVIVNKLTPEKDNIAVAIGHTAAMIMLSINGGMQKAGKVVPGDVMFHASQEIVSSLVELAVHLNLATQDQFAKVYQASLFEGVRLWGKTMGTDGNITAATQQDAQQQLKAAGIKQGTPTAGKPAPSVLNDSMQPGASPPGGAPPAQPPGGVVNQALQGQ